MKKMNKVDGKISREVEEMIDCFLERTDEHINLVRRYCERIYEYFGDTFDGIIDRGSSHDESKYKEPEIVPYIFISWQYKLKNDGIKWFPGDSIENKMNKAAEYHINNNSHHPEYHCARKVDPVSEKDENKPLKEIVDATLMPNLDIAEMVADWCAMSDELGGHPKDWADKNIGTRWKFTPEQKKLIYNLIDRIFDGS